MTAPVGARAAPPGAATVTRWLAIALLWLWAGLAAMPIARAALPAGAPAAVALDGRQAEQSVWPALRVRLGLPEDTSLAAAARDAHGWLLHTAPEGNLGPQRETVGLAFALQVGPGGGGDWVLEIDYPSLDHVEILLLSDGQPPRQWTLGDAHPYSQRPLASRALAVPLELQEGRHYQVVALARSTGSMIVPMRLVRPEQFRLNEARHLLLQGLLGGAMACLLVYALAQGRAMRELAFLWCALNVAGTAVFFFSYNGLGVQHLWGEQAWAAEKMTMLSALLGLGSAFLYVEAILGLRQRAPRLGHGMRLLASVLFIALGLFALDLISYRAAHLLNVLLSPVPLLLALPTAWRLARAGDTVARYLLAGWAVFGLCALCFTLLQRGLLPHGFWTAHAFQFGSLAELLSWMAMLGLRTQAARTAGELAMRERDLLATLAHTDGLTGLLNRRGLQAAATERLAASTPEQPQAVCLIDLNRFKPVNDLHGHDAGDAVLREVAQRLKTVLRSTDLVARLGGDEFVVVAGPLAGEAGAQVLRRKLQQAVATPFTVNGQLLDVGMALGCVLAPQAGRDLQALLKQADAGMYADKQAGRPALPSDHAGRPATAGSA